MSTSPVAAPDAVGSSDPTLRRPDWASKPWPEGYHATPDDPDAEPFIDQDLVDPKVGLVISGFREVLHRASVEAGLTFEDVRKVIGLLVNATLEDPRFVRYHLEQHAILAFEGDGTGVAQHADLTPSDAEGPVYYAGAPRIPNPGRLPMRDDEDGVPLVVTGRIVAADGTPLPGAELDVWLAAASGHYSNTGLGGLPDWTLRGVQVADDDGAFEFTSVMPVPYYMPVRPWVFDRAILAQGQSLYRARHLHFKIRHPRITEFTTQVYFRDDPYLRASMMSAGRRAIADRLAISTQLHTDEQEIEAAGFDRPFRSGSFVFRLPLAE